MGLDIISHSRKSLRNVKFKKDFISKSVTPSINGLKKVDLHLELEISSVALCLILCQLCHWEFVFALVTQAEKWHAREESARKAH